MIKRKSGRIVIIASGQGRHGFKNGKPDEVAPSVVFLCTDVANRVTGCTYDASAGDSVKYTA